LTEIKDKLVLLSLLDVSYHKKLIYIISWLFDNLNTKRGEKLVLTSGYRMNDSGVHGQIPCRGIDIRSRVFADPVALVQKINEVWIYDPARPGLMVAKLHDTGQGMHIHLQAHNNTTLRFDKEETWK
jgi:hypothetical protein